MNRDSSPIKQDGSRLHLSFWPKSYNQSCQDSDVRQVKNGPPTQSNEVEDIPTPEKIRQISGSATEYQRKTDECSLTLEPGAGVVQYDCACERC